MRYTEQAAHALHNSAKRYQLSGAELLADYGAVTRWCNGIGADWMPDCMTALCTKLNGVMEVPAVFFLRRMYPAERTPFSIREEQILTMVQFPEEVNHETLL